MGTSNVTVGRTASIESGAGPIGSNDTRPKDNDRPMYGLSAVFQVKAPVTISICGRTAKVRDKLLEFIESNEGAAVACGDVTDAQLAAITVQLDLADEGITAIAEGDFDGLTALTNLRLSGNDLSTLPAGVFDELTELTDLSLAGNDLSTLPAGVFDELTELTDLRLDGNDLSTLPAGVFDELTELTDLSLAGNDLSTLPAGVFDELTELTDLSLAGNDLSTLPAGVFDELTELTDLSLAGNDLSTLPAGVFDELTKLEVLNLSNSGLTSLRPDAFDALTSLESLYIDTNELTALPAGVFDGLMQNLLLFDNDLSTLPAGVFDGLTALQNLLLYDNDLSTLPAGVFEQLTALTQLNLLNNPGAPFAPTAVAVPDEGEVSTFGGDVTLDGSGSGSDGAWGTNVTYGWELTDPVTGVRATFDDDTSATPVVTFPALLPHTEMTFTLTVTGRGGTNGVSSSTDTAKVSVLLDLDAGICGRTAEVREWLLLDIFYENSGVEVACANVTDAHLALLRDPIPLANMSISAIAFGDFHGLTGVKELSLGGNDLTTLPGGAFLGLDALEKLGLGSNDLTSLDILTFHELLR